MPVTGGRPRRGRPRIGCLGLGRIGCHRLQSVAEMATVEIVGIADPDADARTRAGAVVPTARAVGDLAALLALDLDGVMIATPSALHAQQAIEALSRGVAVFAQKPLARSLAETTAVLKAARRANSLLAVDFSYRFAAALRAIADEVHSGRLGRVYAVDLVFHNAYGPDRPWFYDRAQSGGGCLIDLGSHLVDLALWWLDEPVAAVSSRVFTQGGRLASATVNEDYAAVRMDLASGAIVTITCSWHLPAGRDAVIGGHCYGTAGGAAFWNVNGSFYDFTAERFEGTRATRLAQPPDAWGGRAAMDWAGRLARGERYDPAVERIRDVADVLDRAYADITSRTDAPAPAGRPPQDCGAAAEDAPVPDLHGAAPDGAAVS